ncbi:hypothetical protein IE996_31135 [Klebsiella pneumoniae]|uniref:Uncharacterized protein n=1 Tax=Klebsiella pneumoniae TaxID=573 RepID=A0A927HPU2_KLEPN|nr:hypothetical protein [Klebsiella pneumoniae]
MSTGSGSVYPPALRISTGSGPVYPPALRMSTGPFCPPALRMSTGSGSVYPPALTLPATTVDIKIAVTCCSVIYARLASKES